MALHSIVELLETGAVVQLIDNVVVFGRAPYSGR